MNDIVVSNSSPLIALEQISQLDVARSLFNTVIVPPAVVQEVSPRLVLPPWIVEQSLTQPLASHVLAASLGPGEREAICLAIGGTQIGCCWMICQLVGWRPRWEYRSSERSAFWSWRSDRVGSRRFDRFWMR